MLSDFIAEKGLKPVLAVNTHGHFDHAMGVQYIKATYGVPFALSLADKSLVEQGVAHAMMFGVDAPNMPSDIEVDLSATDVVRFGDTELKIIPTPGHTPGGVALYNEQEGVLFTGDTLFKGSIGRTDLPGGDYVALMNSILSNIIPLGDEVKVYPGHGDSSTIGQESLYNPFVTEALNGEVNYK